MYLRRRFGDIQFTPATVSGTNQIYFLNGTAPLRVVKIAGLKPDDIFNEYHCLKFLEKSGLAPTPESIDCVAGATVLTMEARRGQNLLEIILALNRTAWPETLPYYWKLGDWLARIHTYRYMPGNNIRSSELQHVKEALWSVAFVPEEVRHQSYEALGGIEEHETEWVLTHGDYGVHNVLVTEAGEASVIDWEFGEWNDALNDVANVHFWTHLHFPETATERCRSFLEGYTSQRPIRFSADLLRSYCIYRVWVILLRVGELPEEVKAEWVRRLRWALQHDFTA
jgi:aminoglycoside phosphotransferase (APT) family kinase protein